MHQELSDNIRREPLEPTIVRIDPLIEDEDVAMQYTYLMLDQGERINIQKLSAQYANWETKEVYDMMAEDDWGFRFCISSEKTNGGPLILRDRMIFSPVIFYILEKGEAKPMHCRKCAEAYVGWLDYQQPKWAEAFHGEWYEQYSTGETPSVYN